jgi:large subunit ribosomal protein L4
MAELKLFNIEGKEKESRQVEGALFNSEVRPHLLHEYVVGYQRNMRQGTAATKTRTMVRGGGHKPWRQKGTGRARAGTNTSPIWTGGGIAWGPHPRTYYRPFPKKFKRAALVSAFSHKAAENRIRIVELPTLEKPSTRTVGDLLKNHEIYHQKTLLLYEGKQEHLEISGRNIKWLNIKRATLVNPFDLVWADHVLLTSEALAKIEEVFGG